MFYKRLQTLDKISKGGEVSMSEKVTWLLRHSSISVDDGTMRFKQY